jgi:hypothetical protein
MLFQLGIAICKYDYSKARIRAHLYEIICFIYKTFADTTSLHIIVNDHTFAAETRQCDINKITGLAENKLHLKSKSQSVVISCKRHQTLITSI